MTSIAQFNDVLPVYEEDHHVPIYENGAWRILNVTCDPMDTTDFHRHCHPILYLTLLGTHVSLQEPHSEWKQVILPTNWIGHDIYSIDSCYIHRFSVSGETGIHILAFEALSESVTSTKTGDIMYDDGGFSLIMLRREDISQALEKGDFVFGISKDKNQPKFVVIQDNSITEFSDYSAYTISFEEK